MGEFGQLESGLGEHEAHACCQGDFAANVVTDVVMGGDELQRRWVASFGPFRLFAAERLLEKADQPLQLGGRALDILIALVERAGAVVTRKELILRVWPD